jgi:hypothetical protein
MKRLKEAGVSVADEKIYTEEGLVSEIRKEIEGK